MKQLHIDLLFFLRPAGPFGLPVADLLNDVRRGRHRQATQPQVESALRDLADKSFATAFTSALDQPRWRITALGLSALQEEAL